MGMASAEREQAMTTRTATMAKRETKRVLDIVFLILSLEFGVFFT